MAWKDNVVDALGSALNAETDSVAGKVNMYGLLIFVLLVGILASVTTFFEFILKLSDKDASLGGAPILQLVIVFGVLFIACVSILVTMEIRGRGTRR